MKKITALVVVLVCAVSASAQVLVNPDLTNGDNGEFFTPGAGPVTGNIVGGFDRNSVSALSSAHQCVDPKMIHHVDPSIDPKIVVHYSTDAWAHAQPEMVIVPSPELILPEFKLHDFKGAIPLPNGTLELKPGDSLRISVPNLDIEIPSPRVRVPKP